MVDVTNAHYNLKNKQLIELDASLVYKICKKIAKKLQNKTVKN